MSIANHRLQISESQASLDFYKNKLGMLLISQYKIGNKLHYFLSFGEKQDACLELVFDPDSIFSVETQPSLTEGYWKFAIAVPNLQMARDHLMLHGINVSPPFKVKKYCIPLPSH